MILLRSASAAPSAALFVLVVLGWWTSVGWIALAVSAQAAPAAESGLGPQVRRFEFEYAMSVDIDATDEALHVFVPLPAETEHQHVLSIDVDSNLDGAVEREPRYGNRFWHGEAARVEGGTVRVKLTALVERRVHEVDPAAQHDTSSLSEAQRALFLSPNDRVVVNHPILDPILAEVRERAETAAPPAIPRSIYDWVVDNVEYKKVGSGWGNGDTFWACTERYGNCTDFHALFTSLARTEGIPARFEIGFPIPTDRSEGEIGGYHCWVAFHLPGAGWVPIDASEAFKHPERREFFFGTHPADRIHFTTGRDLRLGDDHHGPALNYFVYPHIEVGGVPWTGAVERSFVYRDVGVSSPNP